MAMSASAPSGSSASSSRPLCAPTPALRGDLSLLREPLARGSGSGEVVAQFAAAALGALEGGLAVAEASRRRCARAGKALGLPAPRVEACVRALGHVLAEAAGELLGEAQAAERLAALGVPQAAAEAAAAEYAARRDELRGWLARQRRAALAAPAYSALEWRLDVQLASRARRHVAQPGYLLKLTTRQGGAGGGSEQTYASAAARQGSTQTHWLEADYASLVAVRDAVGEAVAAARSARTARAVRQARMPANALRGGAGQAVNVRPR